MPFSRKEKPDPEAEPVPAFDDDVPPHVVWRRVQLVRMGFQLAEAKMLSKQPDIVRDARRVLAKGATVAQAWKILK
jgi:hypothetical protein